MFHVRTALFLARPEEELHGYLNLAVPVDDISRPILCTEEEIGFVGAHDVG